MAEPFHPEVEESRLGRGLRWFRNVQLAGSVVLGLTIIEVPSQTADLVSDSAVLIGTALLTEMVRSYVGSDQDAKESTTASNQTQPPLSTEARYGDRPQIQ